LRTYGEHIMNDPIKSNRPHTLVIVAAVSVILLSGVGVARMLDILPDSQANAATISADAEARERADAEAKEKAALARKELDEKAAAEAQAAKQAAAQKQAEAERWRLAETQRQQAQRQAAQQQAAQQQAAQQQAAICQECGIITAITEQPGTAGAPASGLGAVTGAVIGGVLGNQVGKGDGRRAARIAGALGGAYAGHMVEGKVRTSSTYVVSVRFEDGRVEQFTYAEQPSAFVGMMVRSEAGQLVPRN